MTPPTFDPGLTQKYSGELRRIINPDGSFNVRRRGLPLRNFSLYLMLIEMSWLHFFAFALSAFLMANAIFAWIYLQIGPEYLQGAETGSPFLNCFFFSVHTLTTVGYGSLAPRGAAMSAVAGLEAMFGVMGFAIITGLLYGRFSRPNARILFSRCALVAPYGDRNSLQFRIANGRHNNLIDLDAKILLMTVRHEEGQLKRSYQDLRLERERVYFFPLTWTVLHVIDSSSPLYGLTATDLAALKAEMLILIRGFDETFSQVVHARFSYRHDEIVWGARFTPAFHVDGTSGLVVELNALSDHEPAALPPAR